MNIRRIGRLCLILVLYRGASGLRFFIPELRRDQSAIMRSRRPLKATGWNSEFRYYVSGGLQYPNALMGLHGVCRARHENPLEGGAGDNHGEDEGNRR